MRFDVVTLFPNMIMEAASYGITGRAIDRNIVDLYCWNPRTYTADNYQTVDDQPYGGGPGMVLKYQPLLAALQEAKRQSELEAKVVYLSPQGQPVNQTLLVDSCSCPRLILIAGRYEGIDERFVQNHCDEEWSIGDYVISGGELAALVVIDAITRLLPGVLGDNKSANQDSYMNGLLDYPHYTRPDKVSEFSVPSVLTSGNHAEISRWRMKQALGRTWQRRPDLLNKVQLSTEQENLLKEYILEIS